MMPQVFFTDVNECIEGNTVCPDHSTCKNAPGSYECPCNEGYEFVNGACDGKFVLTLQEAGLV